MSMQVVPMQAQQVVSIQALPSLRQNSGTQLNWSPSLAETFSFSFFVSRVSLKKIIFEGQRHSNVFKEKTWWETIWADGNEPSKQTDEKKIQRRPQKLNLFKNQSGRNQTNSFQTFSLFNLKISGGFTQIHPTTDWSESFRFNTGFFLLPYLPLALIRR